MAGVGARAQQQEISGTFGGGGLLWPFQVSVDRTWVPRDTREVLKTFFPCHQLQPSVCSQALLHTCSHSPSLVLKLVDKGKCNMATGPINKGKSDLVPPSCSHTACGCKDTWERLSATQAPCLVLGPGLLLQGGKRKENIRLGQRNILCFWPFPGEGPRSPSVRWLCWWDWVAEKEPEARVTDRSCSLCSLH